ncbi:MAG: glycosyltransferase family 4 protein [Thermoplasmatota archaeon]
MAAIEARTNVQARSDVPVGPEAGSPTRERPDILLLVHKWAHPAHAAWADAAGLEERRWLRDGGHYPGVVGRDFARAWAVPRARLLVAEGGGPAGTCAFARVLSRSQRSILLAADETWARLARGVPEPLPWTEQAWWRVLARGLDGAIAVSPYVARDLAQLFPGLPVRIVRPFVPDPLAGELHALAPSLEGMTVVHIANRAPKNGTGLLLEAWPRVVAEIPDARLRLVGADGPLYASAAADKRTIEIVGRVPAVGPELQSAALFAMPGLGQACPVATMEAMLAGVPVLVSEETGTEDWARAADPCLVVPPTSEDVAAGIVRFLRRDVRERRRFGEAARREVASVTEVAQRGAFCRALEELTGLPLRPPATTRRTRRK